MKEREEMNVREKQRKKICLKQMGKFGEVIFFSRSSEKKRRKKFNSMMVDLIEREVKKRQWRVLVYEEQKYIEIEREKNIYK